MLRGKLLQYHFAKARGQEWARHLVWLVERHPESQLLAPGWPGSDVASVRGILADERLMETLKALWQRAIVANPSNVPVLLNAARFYASVDLAVAMEALRRARVLEPNDPKVAQQLMEFVVHVWTRDGLGREELRRLLEGAKDAEETGELGRYIVGLSISARLRASEDPAQARMEGVKLLERARALDSTNAKWAVGLELARLGQMVRIQGAPVLSQDEVEKVGSPIALLRLRVGADGTVQEAVPLEGPAALLAPAVQSAMKEKLEARGREYEAAGMVWFLPPPRRISVEPEYLPPAKRITVGGNEMNAMLAEKVEPEYPPLAKQARIQGVVRFTAIVAKDGGVANLTLVNGHPLLVQAAVTAVKQWRFKPTMLNGEPVEVVTQVEVPFTLPQ